MPRRCWGCPKSWRPTAGTTRRTRSSRCRWVRLLLPLPFPAAAAAAASAVSTAATAAAAAGDGTVGGCCIWGVGACGIGRRCGGQQSCFPPSSKLTWHVASFSRPRDRQEEHEAGSCVGLDLSTGEPADPHLAGILDNYCVKKQILQRWGGRYWTAQGGTARAACGGDAGRRCSVRGMGMRFCRISWCRVHPVTGGSVWDALSHCCAAPPRTWFRPDRPARVCCCCSCSAPVVASQLLLVDEVLRAGMNMRR